MKKVIISLLLVMLGLGAQAQLRTSRTFIKQKSRIEWMVRAGVGIDNVPGIKVGWDDDISTSSVTGLDFDLGFNKFFKDSEAYWGMELGLNNRGCKLKTDHSESDDLLFYTVKLSPFTVGYRYAINDFVTLDPHIGIWAAYDLFAKRHGEVEEESAYFEVPVDAGVQLGVGAWISRFNIDIMYQRGFIPTEMTNMDGGKSGSTSNILIRVGVKF